MNGEAIAVSDEPARAVDRASGGHRLRRCRPPVPIPLLGILAVTIAASFASTGCGREDDREPEVPVMSCDLKAIAECDEVIGGMSIMQPSAVAEASCAHRFGVWTSNQ